MSPWSWLLIIVIIIVVVWFLISQASKTQTTDIQPHHEETEAHPPADVKTVEAVLEAPVSQADDLASLEGIGPKINSLLHEAGITTFSQLATTDVSRLREILDSAGLKFTDPSSWGEQARLAAEGRFEELVTLQSTLKGGRRAG